MNDSDAVQWKNCAFLTFVGDPDYFYVSNLITCILNCIFIAPATLGNAMVIIAVRGTPSLRTSSNALLMSLASSDLAVGLVAQPAFATWRIMQVVHETQFYCIFGLLSESFGWLLAGVSLCTVTAISVERYLAVYLHLRYSVIVTQTRIAYLVSSFWLIWVTIIILRFFLVSGLALRVIAIHFLVITSAVMLFACTKIYFIVQRHHEEIRHQATSCFGQENNNVIDMARYKKSTITMLYVLGAFLLCYVPFLCVMIMEVVGGETESSRLAYLFTVTFIFINSSLNPIIYCWRIKEIRRAILKVITWTTSRVDPHPIARSALMPAGTWMELHSISRSPRIGQALAKDRALP